MTHELDSMQDFEDKCYEETDNLSPQMRDKIKKELYELLRNPYLEASETYQIMDKFLNSLTVEDARISDRQEYSMTHTVEDEDDSDEPLEFLPVGGR